MILNHQNHKTAIAPESLDFYRFEVMNDISGGLEIKHKSPGKLFPILYLQIKKSGYETEMENISFDGHL